MKPHISNFSSAVVLASAIYVAFSSNSFAHEGYGGDRFVQSAGSPSNDGGYEQDRHGRRGSGDQSEDGRRHSVSVIGVAGQCGSANGATGNAKPEANLCVSGTASAVAGNGDPWTWVCTAGGGASSCWSTLPAYYVSPSGSDSNHGRSPSSPFGTLERARSAMQSSSTPKITYLMGGIYNRTSTLHADLGQSWVGYPGQKAVLDGGNEAVSAFTIYTSNVTIRNLTIQNFLQNGVNAGKGKNLIIDGNVILNNLSKGTWQTGNAAASILLWDDPSSLIINNTISGSTGFGIMVGLSLPSFVGSGVAITNNRVYDTCTNSTDCGGIYVAANDQVLGTYDITGYSVTNNIVGDCGTKASEGKAIYLDSDVSNVTVSGNIVYGVGSYAFQIHGGQKNIFTNNIFDISQKASLAYYQDCVSSIVPGCLPTAAMNGNVIENNIIYSSSTPPPALWDYENEGGQSIALPRISNNLYFGTVGRLPNTGSKTGEALIDSSPIVADPLFVDPKNHDYRLQPGSPALGLGFSASQ